jgi:hypothetical protein
MATPRVGGGPTEPGANAVRYAAEVQQAYYNGWKSLNGLKHQTVDCSLGMTVDMCGPVTMRRHDVTLLHQSKIIERLKALQIGEPEEEQIRIFGDSAYPHCSHLFTYFDLTNYPNLRGYNYGFKSARISIEWNYSATGALWPVVTAYNKLRVLSGTKVAKIYTVATLLRNFHIALYGYQSSNYFSSLPPMDGREFLTHYINQTDFTF